MHSELLSLRNYERYTKGHPGVIADNRDTFAEVKKLYKSRRKQNDTFTVLEVGAGPGNMLTQLLGTLADEGGEKVKVYVNEPDPPALETLKLRQTQYFNEKTLHFEDTNGHPPPVLSPRLIMQEKPEGVVEWLKEHPDLRFDAIVSNGTMHHLKYGALQELFTLANKMLKPGGRVINGEEHLDYTLPANMLGLLGVTDEAQVRAFHRLCSLADQIVVGYPGQDEAQLQARYKEELKKDETKAALAALELPGGLTALELRKHLRPAVTVAHHVGYVISTAWEQGKIKIPAMEFMAAISNMATCKEYFETVHHDRNGEAAPGHYNRLAAKLLGLLTNRLRESDHMGGLDREWEAVEPGATQDNRVGARESREAVIKALGELHASLLASPQVGLPNPPTIYEPDLRYEFDAQGLATRKGGEFREGENIDRKMTPMELARIAAESGFVMELKRNGGNGYTEKDKRLPLSVSRPEKGIVFNEPAFGGMCVTVASRANEVSRER